MSIDLELDEYCLWYCPSSLSLDKSIPTCNDRLDIRIDIHLHLATMRILSCPSRCASSPLSSSRPSPQAWRNLLPFVAAPLAYTPRHIDA